MKNITSSFWFKVSAVMVLTFAAAVGCLTLITLACQKLATASEEYGAVDKVEASREAAEAEIESLYEPVVSSIPKRSNWKHRILWKTNVTLNMSSVYSPKKYDSDTYKPIYELCENLVKDTQDDYQTTYEYLIAGYFNAQNIASIMSDIYMGKGYEFDKETFNKIIFTSITSEDFDMLFCNLKNFPRSRALAFRSYFKEKVKLFSGRIDLAFTDIAIDVCVLKYLKNELGREFDNMSDEDRAAMAVARLSGIRYHLRKSLFAQAENNTEHEYTPASDKYSFEEFQRESDTHLDDIKLVNKMINDAILKGVPVQY